MALGQAFRNCGCPAVSKNGSGRGLHIIDAFCQARDLAGSVLLMDSSFGCGPGNNRDSSLKSCLCIFLGACFNGSIYVLHDIFHTGGVGAVSQATHLGLTISFLSGFMISHEFLL